MSPHVCINGAKLSAFESITPKKHGVVSIGSNLSLACGRVHEAMGDAADMFAVALAAHAKGPVVWIGRSVDVGSLAPTGFQEFFDPTRVVTVTCVSRQETLWATEQALRLPGTACVVAELGDGPDLQTSRRLQIAAEEGGALGVILISGRAQTSAAQTRWQCDPITDEDAFWGWRLVKNKNGKVGFWRVGWAPDDGRNDHAQGFVLVAAAAAA
ncbi:ImuA family protein [Hyphococcus lacteus]|uniref:Protein ImuA n=1 Tax=Hyphococcus lacteus TaxID=3143536 RepID=A0ABV3Z4J8_9PROT